MGPNMIDNEDDEAEQLDDDKPQYQPMEEASERKEQIVGLLVLDTKR